MLHTITPAHMKALEGQYMQETGVPGILLMEYAAQAVTDALWRHAPGGCVLFLCGPGNNGGDGYAAARLWQRQGGKAMVWEISNQARGDALVNRTLCLQHGIPCVTLTDVPDLPACDAVCDALFGTGLSRGIDGIAAELIDNLNQSGKPVIAVDIPSGLDGATGEVLGKAVCAKETVTFHRLKPGLVLKNGPALAGRITAAPILIPTDYTMPDLPAGMAVMTPDDLARAITPRPVTAHKGTFGRVVIFAGSPGMAGAAALCANAAIKTGAGLTTLICRASILPTLQVLAPGATCIPLPEEQGRLSPVAIPLVKKALSSAASAAFGCGIGQQEDLRMLLPVFAAAPCPVVWDADALNLASAASAPLGDKAVCTPHPAEAARLLHFSTQQVLDRPEDALALLQARCPNVLLKGARTLMRSGERMAVNLYGSPAMAKGGSGDVLTGILAALLARPIGDPLLAMQTACLIHGLSGIRAEGLYGENCVTPQDLVQHIRTDLEGLEGLHPILA